MNVETAGHAGTATSKLLNTESIEMFRHPNYYKELRTRNKSDQAISDEASTEATSVRPDPGPKQQASSDKLKDPQATSDKHQAPSSKRQA